MKRIGKMILQAALAIGLLFACANGPAVQTEQSQEIYQNSYDHLRKQIGVVLFQNKTDFQDPRLTAFLDSALTGTLQEACDQVVLISDRNPGFAAIRTHQPRRVSGKIDNMTLAEVGRSAGLNAIVAGSVSGIHGDQEELGYLWFKDMVYFLEVYIHCSVYDTETGAKLLDRFIRKRVDIPQDQYRQLLEKQYEPILPEINQLVLTITRQLVDEICGKLEDELFKTYLTGIDGDQVQVAAGADVGLRPGDLLRVHDSSRVITGKEDYHYTIAGLKIGVVRIDTVSDHTATGTVIQGQVPGKDVCLKPIDDPPFYADWLL